MKTSEFFAFATLAAFGVGPHAALGALLRRSGGAGTNANAASGTAEGALSSLARLALHPELVATLLDEVEESWVQGRLAVMRGDVVATIAREEAMASCRKVANSIVLGSEGVFDKAKVYMNEVCTKFKGKKGNHTMCHAFGQDIVGAMVGDPEYNREELNLTTPCGTFYDGPVAMMAKDFKESEDKELQVREQIASQTRNDAQQEMRTNDQAEKLEDEKMRQAESSLHPDGLIPQGPPSKPSNASVATASNATVASKPMAATSKPSNATPAVPVAPAVPATTIAAMVAPATTSAPPAEVTTSMSPLRARLQETIRKTQEAVTRHEKENTTRAMRNASKANTSA
jgi:hypothetical protein